jgi:hypothetical protein
MFLESIKLRTCLNLSFQVTGNRSSSRLSIEPRARVKAKRADLDDDEVTLCIVFVTRERLAHGNMAPCVVTQAFLQCPFLFRPCDLAIEHDDVFCASNPHYYRIETSKCKALRKLRAYFRDPFCPLSSRCIFWMNACVCTFHIPQQADAVVSLTVWDRLG